MLNDGKLLSDLVISSSGDADPSAFCQALDPGGSVNAVPVYPLILLNDISKIDPHAKHHLAVFRNQLRKLIAPLTNLFRSLS
jgi:hypothetical protein